MTTAQKVIKYLAIALGLALVVSIFSGLVRLGSLLTGGSQRLDPEAVEATFVPQGEITALDIQVAGTELRIRTGDTLKVETNNAHVSITQKDTRLVIREESRLVQLSGSKVTIYLPETLTFDTVDLQAGAGLLSVERLVTGILDLELGAGKTAFSYLEVTEEGDLEGGAGLITIDSGSLHNLSLEIGVGEARIRAAITGDSEIHAGVGSLKLEILGSRADYTIDAEKGLGSITIDGESIAANVRLGSGQHRLGVEGGIGSISMRFEES